MTHLPDPLRQPEFYNGVLPKRLVAWLMDSALIFLCCLLALPLTGFLALFFWPFLYLLIGFLYRVVTISGFSATPGMMFMGLELRNAQGALFDGQDALKHTAGFTISFAIPILQVVSIVLMATSARGQGLSDNLIGSVVLNRRVTAWG
jgi:uncharacterized RDD family membrane protein YckC